MKIFIANWKANKNLDEAYQWIDTFLNLVGKQNINNKVIIAPPFPLLYPLKEKVSGINNLYLGNQDISVIEEGSYTGEVTAKMLKGVVDFTLIGHSERRQHFGETQGMIVKKIDLARKYGIEPVLCIRDENDFIPAVKVIAYEPVLAIGTGFNESVDKVISLKSKLPLTQDSQFLYGGSVDAGNCLPYLTGDNINGLLVGKASLEPSEFYNIITYNPSS
jgi:triosephosphate isomerase